QPNDARKQTTTNNGKIAFFDCILAASAKDLSENLLIVDFSNSHSVSEFLDECKVFIDNRSRD
ncbi:MAG: hypothetical protein ACK52A_01110, partial [Planctomycetota bacterium]